MEMRSDQRVQTNKSIANAWRHIDGNSNVCPIRHRLQDIRGRNLHDLDDLDFNVETGPVSDVNMSITWTYVLDFMVVLMSQFVMCYNLWDIHNKNIYDLELTVKTSQG